MLVDHRQPPDNDTVHRHDLAGIDDHMSPLFSWLSETGISWPSTTSQTKRGRPRQAASSLNCSLCGVPEIGQRKVHGLAADCRVGAVCGAGADAGVGGAVRLHRAAQFQGRLESADTAFMPGLATIRTIKHHVFSRELRQWSLPRRLLKDGRRGNQASFSESIAARAPSLNPTITGLSCGSHCVANTAV